jgi:hypothetical protein
MLGIFFICLMAILGFITIGGGAWALFNMLHEIRRLFLEA